MFSKQAYSHSAVARMTDFVKRSLGVATIGFSLMLVGCSSDTVERPFEVYPTTGSVTYNGELVEGATVTFMPASNNNAKPAFGMTDANGQYDLTTFASKDGAAEGDFLVTITKVIAPESEPAADIDTDDYEPPGFGTPEKSTAPTSAIPEQYGKVDTSGLSASVSAENTTFDFALTD